MIKDPVIPNKLFQILDYELIMIIQVTIPENLIDLPILEDKRIIQKRNQTKMDNKIDFLWIMKRMKNIQYLIMIAKIYNFKDFLLIKLSSFFTY